MHFMSGPKMNILFLCVCGLLAMFWQIGEYNFSFMSEKVMLMFIVLFICIIFFQNHGFVIYGD